MATLEIRMQRNEVQCSLCELWTVLQWGVPYFNGDLASNDFPDCLYREGGGSQPACERCYNQHAAGNIPTFDHYYLHLTRMFTGGDGI